MLTGMPRSATFADVAVSKITLVEVAVAAVGAGGLVA